jgi:NAD(P)-dependent dehydrogenase (short-subunit alcohol dehydrogenase family)
MTAKQLSGTAALVTGASRGFGRGIATALSQAGADVIGVARDRGQLAELRDQLGGTFTPVAADAADPVVAGQLIDAYRPRLLVLNAGAAPLSRPLHQHTWQTFSTNWQVDVQHAFHWTREALLRPLDPGSVVIAFSSGARRCPAATPAPRPPSGSSPRTRRTSRGGPGSASGSPRCSRS